MHASGDALVVEALERIDATRAAADRVAKATLRNHPGLDGAGRARVARGIIGARCFERRLRWQLSAVGLPHTARARWAAYRVTVLEEPAAAVAAQLGLPGAEGPLTGLASVPWPEDPVERLAVQGSLPTWVARRWAAGYGLEAAHRLAEASNHPGPITLRAARREGGRDRLRARLEARGVRTRPGRLSPDSLHAEARFDIRGDEAWTRGAFEVQDEGSQLIALAVGARPGEAVLDLCAGAGGKTLALADHMDDQGVLYAADVDRARLADLRGRVRRRGLECVRVVARPDAALPQRVDRVLVDAPCSSLGTWRRGPDRRWHVLEAELEGFAALQARLLDEAVARLRPGGRLVYATCTLTEEENPANARALERRFERLERAPCLPEVFGAAHEVELRPDLHGTDGFYVAAWTLR